jgi:UTP--glucose-1-phosphate uridylyltransferase
MKKRIRKAVFPVGGLGTRFLPATKVMPKEMLPICDKPLIQYAVEEARAAGVEQFVFVTSRGKGALEDHFDHSLELDDTLKTRNKLDLLDTVGKIMMPPGSIAYVRQMEPLGLGHAVWCARDIVGDEPFMILLPDDLVMSKTPVVKQLADAYEQTGGNVVAVVDVPKEHTDRYGILDVEKDEGNLVSVKGLVEKPKPAVAPSTLSIIGRYVLLPQVFEILAKQQRGAGNEIQLTDAMAQMIGKTPFHGLRYEGERFDCGDKIGWLEANIAFALQRPDLAGPVKALLKRYA